MKFKKILFIFFVLLITFVAISSVCAADADNFNNTGLLSDDLSDDIQAISQSSDNLLSGNVIVVEEVPSQDGEPNNEMTSKTIKNAIDSASSGDTIIINGKSYQHCHIIVDKQLTIISTVGTTMTPCTSTATSGHVGIFYFTSKASGSVLDGFTLADQSMYGESSDYGVLVNGASNVVIRNCTINTKKMADAIRLESTKNVQIENVEVFNSVNGINIVNSDKVTVKNSTIRNNDNGIIIVGSTNSQITENNIYSNNVAGINIQSGSSNTNIISNNITSNKLAGVNSTSAKYEYVLSNYIAENRFGVYVNCEITRVVINGNFFYKNSLYEIYDDYRTRNLAVKGGEKLQEVNNNYMIGHKERPVYNNEFKYMGANLGSYTYDAVNDVYNYVGSNNGDYDEIKNAVFLGYVFEIDEYVTCPVIYYTYGPKAWMGSGNYELQLSNITQSSKGVYSISIVNENGEIAKDLSSVPVTFYLNKNNNQATPQEGDLYKIVMMKNGTATVRFTVDEFNATGNVVTATVPTPYTVLKTDYYRTLAIDDSNIPGVIVPSTLTVSDMTTYPSSNAYFTATLKDVNGSAINGAVVSFSINSKIINANTDVNGQAKIKISQKEGTYTVTATFNGNDDYDPSSAQAKITVKKDSTKIVASNVNMIPKMAENYVITLKDGNGKALAYQKVTFKVNGKTYNKKTNSKGQATLKLKFTKSKSYKITINFKATNKYKASKVTKTIKVKYSSKTSKLTVPKVTITPKTSKSYTVTLSDGNGKGIAKQKVTVKINGKTYTKMTNSKGKVTVKVKFSSLKTYKVTASYKGSKIYKKASASGSIKVAKTSTSLTAPNMEITPKTEGVYTATLKDSNNKVLASQKVTVQLNGITYTKTTSNNGQISLNFNLAEEKDYSVVVNYGGNTIYGASKASGTISVAKLATEIIGYNKTFSKDSAQEFAVTLKDSKGNALENQNITFTFLNQSSTQLTDANGQAKINLAHQNATVFSVITEFIGTDQFIESSVENQIKISNNTNAVLIDENLPNSEIQRVLDSSDAGSNIEFLGNSYSDISLNVEKSLNIYSSNKTTLTGVDNAVFTINASDVNITNFSIIAHENVGIKIINSSKANILNNSISNQLDESNLQAYLESTVPLPGYGIIIINSTNINVISNEIKEFESGLFASDSSNILISKNILKENNYGIKYGFGVSNTQIDNNTIVDSIGLYTNLVPEGPRGYGIFLNNSAVDVKITNNNITWNHMGISIDSNFSTGIEITSNLISDNVLEGIRFNAGYDLAQNAVEPVVTDNAIYRNARGPSMMILGELSANPGGIYGAGEWNESLRLNIGLNWYGKNQIVKWDVETGVVGYGTMCPRINTSGIAFKEIECIAPGNYSITFYKNGEIASNIPVFEMYATLNNDTEVVFNVINGVGSFGFDAQYFTNSTNEIKISIGSLKDENRIFEVEMSKILDASEIPI